MSSGTKGAGLWWLGMIAMGLPLVAIHLTLGVSILEGYVEACVPYWDSCTSISRTGRHGSAYFIFKAAMLPAAVLGIVFWSLNARWLSALGATDRRVGWVRRLGLVAGLALAAYTLALGHEGGGFNLVRRTGVVLYFCLTYIAQLLVTATLLGHRRWRRSGERMTRLCLAALTIGMISLLLSVVAPALADRTDNAVEWLLALLLGIHGVWNALLWKRSGFRTGSEAGQSEN